MTTIRDRFHDFFHGWVGSTGLYFRYGPPTPGDRVMFYRAGSDEPGWLHGEIVEVDLVGARRSVVVARDAGWRERYPERWWPNLLPEPANPPPPRDWSVGDPVPAGTRWNALPIGTTVRVDDDGFVIVLHRRDGWRHGDDMQDDRHVEALFDRCPARVIDLPEKEDPDA